MATEPQIYAIGTCAVGILPNRPNDPKPTGPKSHKLFERWFYIFHFKLLNSLRAYYLCAYKALHLSSTCPPQAERSTNSPLFMQNEPNFQKSQMNVNPYNTRDYENKSNWTLGKNKPNSNPIKPNLRKAKMNVNSLITKDYRKKDDFAVRKNKANSKPIQSQSKPIQSQSKPI